MKPFKNISYTPTIESLDHVKLRIAIVDYIPQNDDQIMFHSGDVIRIIHESDNWSLGFLRQTVGWFPVCYYTEPILEEDVDTSCRWDWTVNLQKIEELRLKTIYNQSYSGDNSEHINNPTIIISDDLKLTCRSKIVMDFFHSQDAFLAKINIILHEYQEPLRLLRWMPLEDYNLLFGLTEEIHEIHNILYSLLKSVVNINPNHQRLGKGLLEFLPSFLESCTKYSLNISKCVSMAKKYENHKEMIEFMNSRESRNGISFFNLLSLIHKPVQQRKIFYKTIRKLLLVTPLNHIDYRDIIYVWKLLKRHNLQLQREIEIAENSESVKELSNRISNLNGSTLNYCGLIVKRGHLEVYRKRLKRESLFVLFEKVLIVLEYNSKGWNPFIKSEPIDVLNGTFTLIEKIPVTNDVIRAISTWNINDEKTFRIIYVDDNQNPAYIEATAVNRETAESWKFQLQNLLYKDLVNNQICSPTLKDSWASPPKINTTLDENLVEAIEIENDKEHIINCDNVSIDHNLPRELKLKPLVIESVDLNLRDSGYGTKAREFEKTPNSCTSGANISITEIKPSFSNKCEASPISMIDSFASATLSRELNEHLENDLDHANIIFQEPKITKEVYNDCIEEGSESEKGLETLKRSEMLTASKAVILVDVGIQFEENLIDGYELDLIESYNE